MLTDLIVSLELENTKHCFLTKFSKILPTNVPNLMWFSNNWFLVIYLYKYLFSYPFYFIKVKEIYHFGKLKYMR